MARTTKSEAVVLRSLRFGEADRILHLYTLEHGRVGAIAKGIRKTKSRFGGRLEPFSHVEVMLHEGRGELHTVTGAELIRSHHACRDTGYRLNVGLVGAEAVLRLFPEAEAHPRTFEALTRFLDVLDDAPDGTRAELDPLLLGFQLKLLWLSGYLPHIGSCAECGVEGPIVAYSARSGGTVCRACTGDGVAISADGLHGLAGLLRSPLADAGAVGLSVRGAREVLAVIMSSYEYNGGFRLRTLRSA